MYEDLTCLFYSDINAVYVGLSAFGSGAGLQAWDHDDAIAALHVPLCFGFGFGLRAQGSGLMGFLGFAHQGDLRLKAED